jgi:hypothetical protein
LFHAQKSWIQRALVQLQQIAADLLDPARNSVAVQRPKRLQRAQHKEKKSALKYISF